MMKDNKQLDARAHAQAKRAQGLPESTQFAIMKTLSNIVNGACWGFANIDEVKEYYEDLCKDNNVIARKVKGGCLVEVSPEYLISAVRAVDSSLINAHDIEEMKKGMADGYATLEKFLADKVKKEPRYRGVIGIYCINNTPAIRHNGTQYPAFRVNLANTLRLLNEYGFKLKIDGKVITPAQASSNLTAVYGGLVLSPTQTGVFLEIGR